MSSTFSLRIDYDQDASRPERVFESMGLMVQGFNTVNQAFIKGYGKNVDFSTNLDSTQEGSLIANIGNKIRDKVLNISLDRIFDVVYEGTKEKIAVTKKVDSEDDVKNFVINIQDRLKHSEAELESYLCGAEVDLYTVAEGLHKISKALENLDERDKAQFGRVGNFIDINSDFSCPRKPSEIFQIIEKRKESTEVVVIRRASLVPDLKWDLENNQRRVKKFTAAMKDEAWLRRWKRHEEQLWPGDGIRARIAVYVKKEPYRNTQSTENEILEVLEVIEQQRMEQTEINFDDE